MDPRFKVGDKIRARKNTAAYDKYKDTIIIVDKPCAMDNSLMGEDLEHICYIDPLTNMHNGWNSKLFELAIDKIIPRSELDFLDCFQQNFKEGV